MANLKEIRTRIGSVNSTKQITSAMKMVSAAKLKRAQDAVTQFRPYAEKLTEILANLTASLDSSESTYGKEREVKSVLFVAITSNRGLCGAFNANVIKQINKLAANDYAGKEIGVLCIGKKAMDVFKKTAWTNLKGLQADCADLYTNLSFENTEVIAQDLMDAFTTERYDKVVLVYNKFKNAATQILMTEQMLPVQKIESKSNTETEYIFEPSKMEIVENVIPKSLKIQLYKAILDSFASEHGARMTAMHKATDNASDLLKELKLTYNKARQAAITTEILEIVGGAEALDS